MPVLVTSASSKPHRCNRIALIAFVTALAFLTLGVALALAGIVTLGNWQVTGRVNPSSEGLAVVGVICLVLAGLANAMAFVVSVWGFRKGKLTSYVILCLSGLGILASFGLGISMLN
jgi:hypothetical protein